MAEYKVSSDGNGGFNIREFNPPSAGCGSFLFIIALLVLHGLGVFKWIRDHNYILMIIWLIVSAVGILSFAIGIITGIIRLVATICKVKSRFMNRLITFFEYSWVVFIICIPVWIVVSIIGLLFGASITINDQIISL